MNTFNASFILSAFSLILLLIFPVTGGFITWWMHVKQENACNYYYSYGYGSYDCEWDLYIRAMWCVIGIAWTIFISLGFISICTPFRKAFIGYSLFWFIMAFITLIYIFAFITWDARHAHSSKDITEINHLEIVGRCCFHTDEEEREDENGDSFIDYKIYANCPVINQTDPNINWSNCEGDGDDKVCFASDVGISPNSGICVLSSDIVPFVFFILCMLLYSLLVVAYAFLHIGMFYLTKPQQNSNRYEEFELGQQRPQQNLGHYQEFEVGQQIPQQNLSQ